MIKIKMERRIQYFFLLFKITMNIMKLQIDKSRCRFGSRPNNTIFCCERGYSFSQNPNYTIFCCGQGKTQLISEQKILSFCSSEVRYCGQDSKIYYLLLNNKCFVWQERKIVSFAPDANNILEAQINKFVATEEAKLDEKQIILSFCSIVDV